MKGPVRGLVIKVYFDENIEGISKLLTVLNGF